MPRDDMNSLIQRIARQALVTFRNPSAIGANSKAFQENHNILTGLVTQVRASDLRITPRKANGSPVSAPHNPPVTYMHICETDAFSMGVFLLKSGTCIPLHDHPGMNGILKVLYGKVRISCFDQVEKPGDVGCEGPFSPPLLPFQKEALRRSMVRSAGEYTEQSAPCVLTPHKDNLHQIEAVDGPTAFLDILAPPYDPDDGRDCHYYRVLQPLSEPGATRPESPEQKELLWLLEIPQPSEFWCGSEPYPGPQVSL
ncbi:2-aminoethanethiol dioxygenase-like [Scleropages formosus]|uniref:2-aminoethanethiol (cysteamine) dioxygenase b n=1 Tax=Scleropages formosus TaxID=113540 RepID=A0A8C9RH45_SCLFO|nr:2-aminoethanethiol dioxygenase-like [Scleropages formosus]